LTQINNSRTRVCVPICVDYACDLAAAIARAAQLADVIELRFDCLKDAKQLDEALFYLPTFLSWYLRPFIFTFRPKEQGGYRQLDAGDRLSFWRHFLQPVLERVAKLADSQRFIFGPDRCATDPFLPPRTRHFADLELDLIDDPRRRAALASFIELVTPIVSQHNFAGVPADLESIYERAANLPNAIPKIAVRADDITDCLPVLRVIERARREGRDAISIAMGEAGLLTRVLAPSRGAFLTYGSLDVPQATAPGQITASDLRELYRVDSINERTSIMGLIGSPVAHSLSPQMHNAAFATCGIDAVYIPFETRDVRAFTRRMAHPRTRELEWNLRGFSVTAPHKSAIIEELNEVDPAAREIGAVNTVVCEGDALRGYNTDAAAALAPLRGLIDLEGARVALIGAGGAARALLWSLRESNAHTTVFARDGESARTVATQFGASSRQLEGVRFNEFDLVINATPLGTRGAREDEAVASAEQLRGARFAYDLVYNPAETRFLREARAAGCEACIGGLAMLVAQAAAQFELWTGASAPVEVMRAAAERALSGK
jgi:3-dehydroquinate dehydratase/shikimate dehydrogenase